MNKELLSTLIRNKRKENKLTQQEFADKIGVSLMSVVRWENGSRVPNMLIMSKIAEALNTTVGYLMGIEESAPVQTTEPIKRTIQPEYENNPSMAYWGGVADNARRAVKSGQNLGLIYSLLSDAVSTVKAAMA